MFISDQIPVALYDTMLTCFSPLEAIDIDAHLGGAWNVKLKRRVDKFDESLWFVGIRTQNLGLLLCLQAGRMRCGSLMPSLLQTCADLGYMLGFCVFLGFKFFHDDRQVIARECTPQLDRAAIANYLHVVDLVLDERFFFRRSQYLSQPAITLAIVVEAGLETMFRKLVPSVAKLVHADTLTKILHPKHLKFLEYAMTHLPAKTRLSPYFLESAARVGNYQAIEWACTSFHAKTNPKIWDIALENGHLEHIVPDNYQPKPDTWVRVCAGGHYKALERAKSFSMECLEAAIRSGSPATIKMVAHKIPLLEWQPEHIRWAIESPIKLTRAEIAGLPPWELDPVLVIVALASKSNGGKNDWHYLIRGEELVLLVKYNKLNTLRHLVQNGGIVFHEKAYAEACRLGHVEIAEMMKSTQK